MRSQYLKSFFHFLSASFIVRFFNLLKDLILAWWIGPSKLLDIFFFLIAVPNLINYTWNKALETTLLSRYEKVQTDSDKPASRKELSHNIYNLTLFSLFIYLVLSISFPFIILTFFKGYITDNLVLIVFIINIIFVIETFILTIKISRYSEQRFFLPSILPVFQSIVMIAGIILLADRLSLLILSILFAAGGILQVLFILKKEFADFWSFFANRINTGSVKGLLKDSLQLSLASGLSSLNLIIDQTFALNLGEGANSYIHYGNYFLTIFFVLFVSNINTIFFPQFQKYVFQNRHDMLLSDTRKISKVILITNGILLIFMLNHGYFLLTLLLGHGKVQPEEIKIIFYCTLGYAGAFIGFAFNAILVRILHVYREYRRIVHVAFVNVVLNILFNYLFTRLFGVWGIALSTSVTMLILITIYIVFLYRKYQFRIFRFEEKYWMVRFLAAILILVLAEAMLLRYHNPVFENRFLWNAGLFTVSIPVIAGVLVGLKIIRIDRYKVML